MKAMLNRETHFYTIATKNVILDQRQVSLQSQVTPFDLDWGEHDLAVLFTPFTPDRQNTNQGHRNICAGILQRAPSSEMVYTEQSRDLFQSKYSKWWSTVFTVLKQFQVLIIIHIQKIWSLVKGIERTGILSFFFHLLLAIGLCYFFTIQTAIA